MKWSKQKPATEGGYWVRGFNCLQEHQDVALVEIRSVNGELCTNLHRRNSALDDFDFDMSVEDCSPDFEWCGPLPCPSQ